MVVRLLQACLASVFVWSYWPTLHELSEIWSREADYSHGYLVIPLSLVFLWTRRASLPSPRQPAVVAGLALMLLSLIVRYLGLRYAFYALDGYSLALWCAAATLTCFGWKTLRWALPSILFLLFMVPLPYQTERVLSVPLQRMATAISSFGLQCLGQPAFAEGNTIWLGNHQLFVEQACSGLRMFVGAFALAFAYLIFTKRELWEQIILLLCVMPIAVLANSTRIIATGLLYQAYGNEPRIQQLSHDLAGILMIPLATLMFGVVLMYLTRLMPVVQRVSMQELVSRGRADA